MAIIHLIVRVYLDRTDINLLECSQDGSKWIYRSIEGSMFLLLHMACICLQAIMMEKVFYGIPKEFGWYDGLKDDDELESVPEDAPYMFRVKGHGSKLHSDDDY